MSNSVDAMVVSATLVELPESLPSDLSDVTGRNNTIRERYVSLLR